MSLSICMFLSAPVFSIFFIASLPLALLLSEAKTKTLNFLWVLDLSFLCPHSSNNASQ